MYSALLIFFTTVILFISAIYFYLFFKNEEQFLRFWGFAWIAYAGGLFLVLLYLTLWHDSLALEIRKLLDMINILMMLLGVYAFSHVRAPGSWIRFSVYLGILSLLCIVYDLDLYSFYLPISLYQICMGLVICWHIVRRWSLNTQEKVIAVISFGIWCLGKPVLSMYELSSGLDFPALGTELVLSNILNFCLLIVYAQDQSRIHDLSDRIYSDVVEHTSDVIFYYMLKPYARMRYITPSVTGLTGYAQHSFYEDPALLIRIIDPSYYEELQDVMNGHLVYDRGEAFQITRRDGTVFWGELKTSIIYNDKGEPDAVEGILRDITDTKNLELEQFDARQKHDQLLSYISHELRTPVTSMAGYLAAVQDGILSEPDQIREVIDILSSRTMTLKQLVDDLDQLSKMETGQFSFNFEVIDLLSLSQEMADEAAPDISAKGFFSDIRGLDQIPSDIYVAADRIRIEQVFRNLVSNAIKYSSPGTTITITFSLSDDCKGWLVSVCDQGPGIDDADILHIFDRFYRGSGSSARAVSGRGLGLTLSKDIIEAHDGQISVENNSEAGCTFTFSLPVLDDSVL